MTLTVVLAARASSDLQNKGSLRVFCQTSHRPPQCFTGGGHSYSPPQPLLQVWSTEALYRRRVPVRHSTPSPGWHTVLAAPSGGSASTVSSRLTPSGQGAKFGQPRVTRHDRLRTHHPPFHLAQVLFIIFWGSGSGGTSREVRSAHTQATSSSTASSTIQLPRQLWSEGAPLFPHAARSLIGHLSESLCPPLPRVFLDFPSSWKVRESPGLLGLRKLDGNRASWSIRTSRALSQLRKLDGNRASWLVREFRAPRQLKKLDGGRASLLGQEFRALRQLKKLDPGRAIYRWRTRWLRRFRRLGLYLLGDVLVVQAWDVCSGHLRRGSCGGAHGQRGLRKRTWPPCRGEMAM